ALRKASPVTRAPGGNNPIKARDNIVLPLPDSPTSPRASPGAIRRVTSFTGRTQPATVGSSTVSDRIFSNSSIAPIIRFRRSPGARKPGLLLGRYAVLDRTNSPTLPPNKQTRRLEKN